MSISRREFLRYCTSSAALLGLEAVDLGLLREALANPAAPKVIWLHGSSCTGCSVSLLNRISNSAPTTVAQLLTESIDLVYHPTIMALAGEPANAVLKQTYDAGGYVLVLEGGVPTAFGAGRALPTVTTARK